ncbi:unnamed protein product, partial [Mesorhabditis belari]|uniref:Uncharacterized protein n=1 Tax=Mesorhabditis belari TaxID=2138241 RepID=A0AAF3J8E8_9BILA
MKKRLSEDPSQLKKDSEAFCRNEYVGWFVLVCTGLVDNYFSL